MDIRDAFTTEVIEATDANVGGDEENELREMIRQVAQSNEVELNRDEESIAVLCFVAGRAFQATNQRLNIEMSREMVGEFLDFLVERSVR